MYDAQGNKINPKPGTKTHNEMIAHLAAAVRILDNQYKTIRGVIGTHEERIKKLETALKSLGLAVESLGNVVKNIAADKDL